MTLLRVAAILIIVNVGVLLWPGGDKTSVLGPRSAGINNNKSDEISLLAERDEYADATTGLVLATMRPDGSIGDPIVGPYYLLSEWDDSVTTEIDQAATEDTLSSEVASSNEDPDFQPILLGVRPDLVGGLRSENPPEPEIAEGVTQDVWQSPDGPAVVPVSSGRLRTVLSQLSTNTTESELPEPVVSRVQTPPKLAAEDRVEEFSEPEVPSVVSTTIDQTVPPESLIAERTSQPDVPGVETSPVRGRGGEGRPPENGAPVEKVVTDPVKPPTKDDTIANLAPTATAQCVRLGPFFSQDSYEKIARLLDKEGMAFEGRSVAARRVKAIRVFLGPFEASDALDTAKVKLRDAGIRDFFIMPPADGKITVSLGLFSTQTTANTLINRLAEYDVGVQSREELRKLNPTFWLEAQAPGLEQQQREYIESIKLEDRHARVRKMACRERA